MTCESINTERLRIDIITPEYAQYVFSNKNDKEICTILGIVKEKDFDKYKQQFGNGGNDYTSFMLGKLRDINTGELVGDCSYHTWKPVHRRAEIGYMVCEPYRKKGIMREALKAMIEYGFDEMGLNRIEACIGEQNEASLKSVEYFGFKKEGYLREHYNTGTEIVDSLIFSLLKSEYVKK